MAGVSILGEVPVDKFVASKQGVDWLEANPAFLEFAKQFSGSENEPERLPYRGRGSIGAGTKSEFWNADSAATIEVSTPTTGRRAYWAGPGKPENLIGQFIFLDALGQHLESRTGGGITVPDQYFAFRTTAGNYLRAEQCMVGWLSLRALATERGWDQDGQESVFSQTVKTRIINAVKPMKFRLGLPSEHLHASNILVPADTDSPETTPLCITDQPGRGFLGKLAVAMLAAESRAPVRYKQW